MDADFTEYQKKIIELLARHEEAVAQLYRVYAVKFPSQKQFWAVLRDEELEHADWIRKLYSKMEEGLLSFNEERFKIGKLYESLDSVMEFVTEVKSIKISFIEALTNSHEIENSIIESNFFEVYKTDSPSLKKLLNDLDNSTRDHRDRIKQALDKVRNSL